MKTAISSSIKKNTLRRRARLGLQAGAFAAWATVATAFAAGGANTTIQVEDVGAKIAIAEAPAYAGHQLGVTVAFGVAPGWHIYGEPLPPEYTPTKVRFDSELVRSQALKFPPPTPLRFDALDQTFPVYHGNFTVAGTIVLKPDLSPGEHQLGGTIEFQECNDSMCKMPQSVHFELPLTIQPAAAAPKA